MNKIIIIIMCLFLMSCSLTENRVEVQTKIIQSPPVFLQDIPPVEITKEQPITITARDALYYSEACNYFQEGGSIGEEYKGLTEASACSWSITGFSPQSWLNILNNNVLIENRMKRIEEQRDFYKQQLKDRYERVKDE